MNKMFATVAAGLALSGMAGVGLSAGLASPAAAATPTAVAGSATTVRHPLRAWLRHHRKAVVRDTVQVSAKTIGISPKALVSALRSGRSIAEVARCSAPDWALIASLVMRTGIGGRAAILPAQRRAAARAPPFGASSSSIPQASASSAWQGSQKMAKRLAREGPTRVARRGRDRQLMFMPSAISGRRR